VGGDKGVDDRKAAKFIAELACSGITTLEELETKLFNGQHGLRSVNRPMAICTEHREIVKSGDGRLNHLSQWSSVVNFANFTDETRIGRLRRKSARLAFKPVLQRQNSLPLCVGKF
jgi:hypothetical protein